MGIGAGELILVSIAVITVILVLLVFPRLELWIDRIREARSYRIVISSSDAERMDRIQEAFAAYELTIFEHHQSKIGETIIGTWHTIGSPKNHDKFVSQMVKDPEIKELVY
jgi:putative Mg2+ transporter-C (MgtC) family protein